MLHDPAKQSFYAKCVKLNVKNATKICKLFGLQVRKLWSSVTKGYAQALQGVLEAIALAARNNATQTVVGACSCMLVDFLAADI